MDKRKVTVEEAISLLDGNEYIHTFRNAKGILFGADYGRRELIKKIQKHKSTLHISGNIARGDKHGLVLEDELGYLFIATDEKKLNTFDPMD